MLGELYIFSPFSLSTISLPDRMTMVKPWIYPLHPEFRYADSSHSYSIRHGCSNTT